MQADAPCTPELIETPIPDEPPKKRRKPPRKLPLKEQAHPTLVVKLGYFYMSFD
jgi:hypothetical protein